MKFFIVFFAVLVSTCLFGADGLAFRCGEALVGEGDTRSHVALTCGKPTAKETICEDTQTSAKINSQGRVVNSRKCFQKTEVWYYDCGDNDYIYALSFENGKLVKETTAGRGKGPSNCLGK